MTRVSCSPRRAAVVLALVVVAAVGVPSVVAGQTDDATAATAIPTQDGWWNRAKGPQPAEPPNPLRPAVGGSVPAPSTVPPTGLGVGAVAGDADKVAAIGLVLEAGPDALVDSLVLRLQETTENGSNLNASSARIVACPITGFWAGVKDGEFVNRPACDDSQSVAGARAGDGSWTFDLTLLGSQWVDPTSGLAQNGVLLMEAVDAPQSFQVSFSDISSGKVGIDFSATAGFGTDSFGDESFATTEEVVPTEEPRAIDDGGFAPDDTATFDSSGSSFSTAAPTRTPVPVARPTTTPTAPAPSAGEVASPTANLRPTAAGDLLGSLPLAALAFLVLVVLGGALFLGLVLGPLAAPGAAVATRTGGVSRALAARAASSSR